MFILIVLPCSKRCSTVLLLRAERGQITQRNNVQFLPWSATHGVNLLCTCFRLRIHVLSSEWLCITPKPVSFQGSLITYVNAATIMPPPLVSRGQLINQLGLNHLRALISSHLAHQMIYPTDKFSLWNNNV